MPLYAHLAMRKVNRLGTRIRRLSVVLNYIRLGMRLTQTVCQGQKKLEVYLLESALI